MSYAPTFSRMSSRGLLKYSCLALACLTILLELIMALTLPLPVRTVAWIGVIFGFIMVVLWSFRQDEPMPSYGAVPLYASSYAPSTSNYIDLSPPRALPPPSLEPAPEAPPKKYRDEHGVQCFMYAKGNDSVKRSQDAYALDNDVRRYAVTDGVSRSFLPSYWARILSTHFVHSGQGLEDEALFAEWVRECSGEWQQQARQWIALAEQRRQEQGFIDATDWQQNLARGAQATLIGCALSPVAASRNGAIRIQVTAIGDANFFLVRHTHNGTWDFRAYPYTDPAAFGTTPDTLATAAATSSKGLQRTWNWINKCSLEGQPGDYMLLATDAIAKWLLQQLQSRQTAWLCLLDPDTTSATLAHLLTRERATAHLEDDDVTVLVVPL